MLYSYLVEIYCYIFLCPVPFHFFKVIFFLVANQVLFHAGF